MITILMAAYNGEKYLAEQIESILHQSDTEWRLVIQDDCSSDATLSIAQKYARDNPERIAVYARTENSGSAASNFFSMLRYADTEYTMFSDDDDVWLPDKIRLTLLKMQELGSRFGQDVPLLVHTDLKVVDGSLQVIADSMMHMQKLKPRRDRFHQLLSQNIVTGCTMMGNQKLVSLAASLEPPESAVMHDWWFALLAAAFGEIGFVDNATILYRQHGANRVGAKDAGSVQYNVDRLRHSSQVREALNDTYEQAREFLARYGEQLDQVHRKAAQDYCSTPTLHKMARLRRIAKNDFWKTGFIRKCGQIWFS